MNERKDVVTSKGDPLALAGNEAKVGDRAPDFTVLDNDLNPTRLADYKGKILIIASVPSLDTSTCDIETRRFNKEAAKLGEDVAILVISMDLPFAQKRWCAAAGVESIQLLSDHRDASFGHSFGVLIKELRLLARTVFIVDPAGSVRYIQYVKETTEEPDYDDALKALSQILKEA